MKKIIIALVISVLVGIYAFLYSNNSSSKIALQPSTASSTIQNSSSVQQSLQPVSYKDGTYVGDSIDAFYGNVQVSVVISNGKISDVKFLDYPKDMGHSMMVSSYSLPLLKQEAIRSQSANVDTISGASQTSQAFRDSLQSALSKAV